MEYTFNDTGFALVCTNADIVGKVGFNYIKVAQFPNGKWVYGYSYQFDQDYAGGGCTPCGIHYDTSRVPNREYDTRREAVLAACKELNGIIKRGREYSYDGCVRNRATAEDIQECISKAYSEVTELTLF